MMLGKLNKRIDILKPKERQQFSEKIEYEDLHTGVPASKEDVAGGETERGRRVEETTTTIFVIRHLDGIDSKMQVKCEGKHYDISRALDETGKRQWLKIHAVEVQ